MTTTWTTPPGSTLPSSTAPVLFTTDRDCTALSVAFAGRVEERAYRDSAFLWPYLDSTVEEVEGELDFTLVRDGGWPSKPRVYVDEEPEPPEPPTPITTFWSELYTADLRTFATQTILANDNTALDFTLDGQPWWAAASTGIGEGSNPVAFVNGQGLRLIGRQPSSGGNKYAGTYCGLRVHEMPGYDPAKLVAIIFRFETAIGAAAATVGCRMHTGGFGYGGAGTGASHVEVNPAGTGYWAGNFTYTWLDRTTATWPNPDPAVVVGMMAGPWTTLNPVYGNSRYRRCRWGLWLPEAPSGFTSVESMQVHGVSNYGGTGENANYRMAAYCAYDNTTARTRFATHVGVYQKAVPS